MDGQAATPASVSSADGSFQQGHSDSTTPFESKVEVKQKEEQEEDEEDEDEEAMVGGRTGKQEDIKSEEKPEVRSRSCTFSKLKSEWC